jgi:hypothetical protein
MMADGALPALIEADIRPVTRNPAWTSSSNPMRLFHARSSTDLCVDRGGKVVLIGLETRLSPPMRQF